MKHPIYLALLSIKHFIFHDCLLFAFYRAKKKRIYVLVLMHMFEQDLKKINLKLPNNPGAIFKNIPLKNLNGTTGALVTIQLQQYSNPNLALPKVIPLLVHQVYNVHIFKRVL
ncbi:unnamed protein product [Brugia timori]|uniref:Uncharacterized protein n=1 Tax=Brugia timori TaxID=42155 RepID=A0A0R3QQ04_9BILA|nr:unnamed protein product [Brugia timori]